MALKLKLKYFELLTPPLPERLMLLLQILQELAQTTEYNFLCEHGFSYKLIHCHNERIIMVNRYVDRHYHQKISLTDMAALVNMSEEYFSRFFSKVMKKPFLEFLNEYKINRACKLLIETGKQISEIYYASGFESILFFYRQFMKFKNYQPKNYRAKYQKILS